MMYNYCNTCKYFTGDIEKWPCLYCFEHNRWEENEAIQKAYNEGFETCRQSAIHAVEESRLLNHHQDGKAARAHENEHRHFLKLLYDLSSIQPEQKVGRWILGGYEDTKWICDKCEYQATEYYNPPKFKYCPNCGEKKVEPQEARKHEESEM